MMRERKVAITPAPGMSLIPDATQLDSASWVDGDKVRFDGTKLVNLAGWNQAFVSSLSPNLSINGYARLLFSFVKDNSPWYLIGTHTKLYCFNNGLLTNITPLKTTSTTIANSIDTTNGLSTIVFDAVAHGQAVGDRVKISGAADVGGITAATYINKEHIITAKTTDTFTVDCGFAATSTVANGGGASTAYFVEIEDGSANTILGYGYGLGLYGMGQYGVGKTPYNSSIVTRARLWSADRYGQNVVLTPGNQGGLYQWTVTTITAPSLVSGAPAAVNYVFVTDNIVCVLGAGGVDNSVTWADQGDLTTWTPAATNQAGAQTLYDMGRLESHINCRGTNLIWSRNSLYEMRYLPNNPLVFEFKKLSTSSGIIGPNARCEFNGVVYWWDNDVKWQKYDGGLISELLDGNGQPISIREYVSLRLSETQRDKIFCGIEPKYSEIWFHYPSTSNPNASGYDEVDSYGVYQINNKIAFKGTLSRTCREYPHKVASNPLMISDASLIYQHEIGNDADGAAMNWYAETNYLMAGEGDNFIEITGVVPDSTQSGNVDFTTYTKTYPQAAAETTSSTTTITSTTERIDLRAYGRQRKYRIAGNGLNSSIAIGRWTETVKSGGAR